MVDVWVKPSAKPSTNASTTFTPIGSRVLTSIVLTLATLGVTRHFGDNVGRTLVGRHDMRDSGSTSLARGSSSDASSNGF